MTTGSDLKQRTHDSNPLERAQRIASYFLLAASKGAASRISIIRYLRANPVSANQLANHLGLDYKIVKNHLNLLEEHDLVSPRVNGGDDAVYFVASTLCSEGSILDELCGNPKDGEQPTTAGKNNILRLSASLCQCVLSLFQSIQVIHSSSIRFM